MRKYDKLQAPTRELMRRDGGIGMVTADDLLHAFRHANTVNECAERFATAFLAGVASTVGYSRCRNYMVDRWSWSSWKRCERTGWRLAGVR